MHGSDEKCSAKKENAWQRRKLLGREGKCLAEKKTAGQRRKMLDREEKLLDIAGVSISEEHCTCGPPYYLGLPLLLLRWSHTYSITAIHTVLQP